MFVTLATRTALILAGAAIRAGAAALLFNGVDANASTAPGTLVTTRTDDIAFEAQVRYDGPNAAGGSQSIVYNGHGAVTGWGILVVGASDHEPEGTLAILSGGVTVVPTPLRLTAGKWQLVRAERRGGVVTVALDNAMVTVGAIAVNALAAGYRAIERTTIGGDGTYSAPSADFHGAVGFVGIRDLVTNRWIERWMLDEARGTTTTGANGTVLCIGTSTWITR